jgi:Ca2+-binding RTX toxin-like protein
VRGTSGPDKLVGTKRADKLIGGRGRDKLIGKRGNDKLFRELESRRSDSNRRPPDYKSGALTN